MCCFVVIERDIDLSMPDFVNVNETKSPSALQKNPSSASSLGLPQQHQQSHHHGQGQQSSSVSSTTSAHQQQQHINYHYLNAKGKQAVRRILCVYEYHYPQVTYNPGLISISSLLLHYMQEHEVFAALCSMSATKEHLIDSKAGWDTACSVFTRLLKSYCVTTI